ncbi:Na+/H+ antiporter subunit E [bacterium]|nr:Na+/H+ antiporter subunit E [bacterium]
MKKLLLWPSFILFFLKELFLANFRVARDVLRKSPRIQPAIVAVPLDLKSKFGLMVLANSITLTPGTLALDISDDDKTMYIHTLYLDGGKEAFIKLTKETFEKRIMELFDS